MSTQVVYDGQADVQEFGPDDFAKEGVETEENHSFIKGHAVEVEDSVAEVLLSGGKGVFKGFGFRKPKKGDVGYDDLDRELAAEAEKQDAQAKVDPDSTGPGATLQESTGGTPTPGSTAGPTGTTAGGGRISTT